MSIRRWADHGNRPSKAALREWTPREWTPRAAAKPAPPAALRPAALPAATTASRPSAQPGKVNDVAAARAAVRHRRDRDRRRLRRQRPLPGGLRPRHADDERAGYTGGRGGGVQAVLEHVRRHHRALRRRASDPQAARGRRDQGDARGARRPVQLLHGPEVVHLVAPADTRRDRGYRRDHHVEEGLRRHRGLHAAQRRLCPARRGTDIRRPGREGRAARRRPDRPRSMEPPSWAPPWMPPWPGPRSEGDGRDAHGRPRDRRTQGHTMPTISSPRLLSNGKTCRRSMMQPRGPVRSRATARTRRALDRHARCGRYGRRFCQCHRRRRNRTRNCQLQRRHRGGGRRRLGRTIDRRRMPRGNAWLYRRPVLHLEPGMAFRRGGHLVSGDIRPRPTLRTFRDGGGCAGWFRRPPLPAGALRSNGAPLGRGSARRVLRPDHQPQAGRHADARCSKGAPSPCATLSTASMRWGVRTDRIRLTGGGARNRVWAQIRADVAQRPVEYGLPTTPPLGAAILAQSRPVWLRRYGSGARDRQRISDLRPRSGTNAGLRGKRYARYRRLFESLTPMLTKR